MAESWVPLPRDPRYFISDHGDIRGIYRNGALLKPTPQGREGNQYLVVTLSISEQGHDQWGTPVTRAKSRQFKVHRLILEAFVGPCPDGMEALHGNGNNFDNRLENLRWGTPRENQQDAIRHGTHASLKRKGVKTGPRTTHCPQGHEYTPENTYHYKGYKQCNICRAVHVAQSNAHAKAKLAERTHCGKGHPYVTVDAAGRRRCDGCRIKKRP